MKKLLYLVLFVAAIGTVGCKKFLDEKPQTELDASNFWKSEDDIKNRASCYV